MRKIFFLTLVMGLLFCSNAIAKDIKIGVINFEGIITQSERGKKAKAKFQQKVKSIEASMTKMQKELEKMQQELTKQSMTLSNDAKAKKAENYRKKVMAFEKKRADSQKALGKAQSEIFEPMLAELVKIAQGFAKKNGYTLLLNAKNTVIYTDPSYDLTDKILKAFDKK